ncbi:hypothetical protein AAF712_016840, partial [Marasmius tenuissimus]
MALWFAGTETESDIDPVDECGPLFVDSEDDSESDGDNEKDDGMNDEGGSEVECGSGMKVDPTESYTSPTEANMTYVQSVQAEPVEAEPELNSRGIPKRQIKRRLAELDKAAEIECRDEGCENTKFESGEEILSCSAPGCEMK